MDPAWQGVAAVDIKTAGRSQVCQGAISIEDARHIAAVDPWGRAGRPHLVGFTGGPTDPGDRFSTLQTKAIIARRRCLLVSSNDQCKGQRIARAAVSRPDRNSRTIGPR